MAKVGRISYEDSIKFSKIAPGDLFKYLEEYYIKNHAEAATSLYTGKLTSFVPFTEVVYHPSLKITLSN